MNTAISHSRMQAGSATWQGCYSPLKKNESFEQVSETLFSWRLSDSMGARHREGALFRKPFAGLVAWPWVPARSDPEENGPSTLAIRQRANRGLARYWGARETALRGLTGICKVSVAGITRREMQRTESPSISATGQSSTGSVSQLKSERVFCANVRAGFTGYSRETNAPALRWFSRLRCTSRCAATPTSGSFSQVLLRKALGVSRPQLAEEEQTGRFEKGRRVFGNENGGQCVEIRGASSSRDRRELLKPLSQRQKRARSHAD